MATYAETVPGERRRDDSLARADLWVLLLYAIIAIGLLAPMASNTILPQAPDHPNHVALIVQAGMAVDDGQFPIRVAPWQHFGWLYPIYQFYSPVPYTVAGLIYRWLTPGNPLYAYKAMYWGALWLAGFFTYATARLLTKSRPAAVLAGVIYMSAPYLMVNVHARAAFTEAMGQGLLPFVVYSSLRCYLSMWLSPWLFLAGIAWALLAMTHNITYVCGSFFVGLLFVGLSLQRRGVAMGLWRLGAAYALGCVLAMYFLAPVLTAAPDLVIQRNLPLMIAFNNLVPFTLLLESISLPSGHSGTPNLNPALGLPTLLAVAACVYAFSHRQPIEATALPPRRMGLLLLALFALAVFLTWSPFDFWQYFPRLVNLPQFTYRFMTYAAWTGSLLSAYALVTLFHGELDRRHVAIGVPLILLAHGSFLPPFLPSPIAVEQLLREPDMGWGASDYLIDFRGWPVADAVPVTAIQPYCLRDGDTYRCHIPVSDAPAVVQLPALYYPRLLDVRVDGKTVPYLLTARDPYPMAGVRLEPGFHAVDVRFRGLGWANWVSGVAWAGVLVILGLLLGRSRLIRSRAIRERVAREPREKAG